tara:strand:- start:8529 stop:10010 length:1482 start_codon:yes stop_codon:yes gene_type:complete
MISVVIHFAVTSIGKNYALASPDYRKKHKNYTPQLGGIIFGPIFLFFCWEFDLVNNWYIIGGIITIILGAIDDIFTISWKIKLAIQLLIALFICTVFWGTINEISFYTLNISLSKNILLLLFLIWFIGLYNAVNLLDGLDGLAAGFMFILCAGLGFIENSYFSNINILLSLILLGFLILNQRNAKIFMGDSGSLFLGYHAAVLPLLYFDLSNNGGKLIMSPFVILVSYLIADTSRVFFTRLADKKSPMTPDTIHLHHLLLQQISSYLTSIGTIYFIGLFSVIFSVYSFTNILSTNIMLGHLSLLLLFILTPPVQAYVPLLERIIKPFYSWQKESIEKQPLIYRTLFILVLLLCLFFSIVLDISFIQKMNIFHFGALLAMILISIISRKNLIITYIFQVAILLTISESLWITELSLGIRLFSSLIAVSYIIFILQKRHGCLIRDFSSLDLLVVFIVLGGITLSLIGYSISFWFCITIFSIWFGISFIFRRIISN